MFKYAQLDDENRVIGISYLKGEVVADNMILINDLEVMMWSTYDRSTGEFTPPTQQPTETPSIEEQILAETQYQTALLEVNALGGNV